MVYLFEYVKTLYDAERDRWTFKYKTMRRYYDNRDIAAAALARSILTQNNGGWYLYAIKLEQASTTYDFVPYFEERKSVSDKCSILDKEVTI